MRGSIAAGIATLVAGVLGFVALPACSSCSAIGVYAMTVKVTDEGGKPICDATVQLVTPDGAVVDSASKANSLGATCSYNLGLDPGRYRLFVSRAGYYEKDSDTFGIESTGSCNQPDPRSETVVLRK